MMKFHSALTAGLATLLVVPAALQQGDLKALEDALSRTDQAIQILRGVHTQFDTDAEGAGALLLAATEKPILDERWRDERLMKLRDSVSRLRSDLDLLQAPDMLPPIVQETPEGPVLSLPRDMPGTGPLNLSSEEALQRALESANPTRPAQESGRGDSSPGEFASNPAEARPTLPLPEGKQYSADPVGHARACYRTARYQQGFELLRGRTEPVAMYWRARCLEKLERLDEAVATLEQVMSQAPDSSEARRARTDLEFLRWKQTFVKNLPKGMQGGDVR